MTKFSLRQFNFRLVLYILLLNIIGIFVIRSAANGQATMVEREIIGACVGMLAMGIIGFFVPYNKILSLRHLIYVVCLVLLVLVLITGRARGLARRWVVLPIVGKIQPSEFVKVGLILFFAKFISDREDKLNEYGTILLFLLFLIVPALLIYLEPDLSTTIITVVAIVGMLFVAGISYKWVFGVLAVLIPLSIIFYFLLKNNLLPFMNSYQTNRILAWINPEEYADLTLQQRNSIMAIASGQLTGKGLSNTTIASVKNGNFLVEEETDFIYAVVGEELGFIGCTAVLVLIALIVIECFRTAAKAADLSGKLICAGLGVLIAFQSFTNIAVALGVFPNTGLPLPFVSYGVSSLLSMYIGMGFVLNVGMTMEEDPLIRRFQ